MPSHKPLTPEATRRVAPDGLARALPSVTVAVSSGESSEGAPMSRWRRIRRLLHIEVLRAEGFEVQYGKLGKSNIVYPTTSRSLATALRIVARWKPIEQGTDSPSSSSGMDSGNDQTTP